MTRLLQVEVEVEEERRKRTYPDKHPLTLEVAVSDGELAGERHDYGLFTLEEQEVLVG